MTRTTRLHLNFPEERSKIMLGVQLVFGLIELLELNFPQFQLSTLIRILTNSLSETSISIEE